MTSEDRARGPRATTRPEAAMHAAAAPVGQSGAWMRLAGTTKDGRRARAISADAAGTPGWFMIQLVERGAQATLRAWDDRWSFARGSGVALTLEIAGRHWQVPRATAEGREIRWLLATDALETFVEMLATEGNLALRLADAAGQPGMEMPLDGVGEAAAWLLGSLGAPRGARR